MSISSEEQQFVDMVFCSILSMQFHPANGVIAGDKQDQRNFIIDQCYQAALAASAVRSKYMRYHSALDGG